MVFVRHGFGRSAFAVVAFAIVVGSRYVLVLVGPRSRWFRLPLWLGRVRCWFWSVRVVVVSFVSMLVRVWCWFFPFAYGVCLRSALVRRGVCCGFRFSTFLVGCGPSRFALVLVVLRVMWLRIIFSWLGAERRSTQARIGKFALETYRV